MEEPVEEETIEAITDEMIRLLIEKLPARLRPLATVYAPVLIEMTIQQIESLVTCSVTDPVEGYQRLYRELSNEQVIEAGRTLKGYWESMNVENGNVVLEQKKAMSDLIVIGLLMLKSALA